MTESENDPTHEGDAGIAIPGPVRDRFADIRPLGRGAMGTVLRARDRELDRDVALKLLNRLDTPELVARFEREARALAAVRHPNVVQVLDHGDAAGEPFLVLELLEGEPLGPGLGTEVTLDAMLQAAEGLEEIHTQGMVHRDIKPGNLLRTPTGRVVVLDLGMAYHQDWTVLTRTGVGLGSLAYMAPETLLGQKATPASDWYAWGVTLYQLVEGSLPFRADGIQAMAAGEHPGPPEFVTLGAESRERRLVLACLSPDPAGRPRSASEVHEILGRERTDTRRRWKRPGGTLLESTPIAVDEPTPRRSGWTLAGLGAIGLLLGLVAPTLLDAPPPPTAAPAAGPAAPDLPFPADLPEQVEASLDDAGVGAGPVDPARWPEISPRLLPLATFRGWLLEGGDPPSLPAELRERMEFADYRFENLGLPRPFFPFAYVLPRPEAHLAPAALAGTPWANHPLPEDPGPWLTLAVESLARLHRALASLEAAHAEASRGLAPLTPMLARCRIPLCLTLSFERVATEEGVQPDGRIFLARTFRALDADLRTLLYSAGQCIRKEVAGGPAAAVLVARALPSFRPLFPAGPAFDPAEVLIGGPPGSAAGWLLLGAVLQAQHRTYLRARLPGLEAPRKAAEDAYLNALLEPAGSGLPARLRRVIAFRELLDLAQRGPGEAATLAHFSRHLAGGEDLATWFSLATLDHVLDAREVESGTPPPGPEDRERIRAWMRANPRGAPVADDGLGPDQVAEIASRLESWFAAP